MEEVYNICQHSHNVIINLQIGGIYYRTDTNTQREEKHNFLRDDVKDRIIYDKKKKEIVYRSSSRTTDEEFGRKWDEIEQRKNEDYVKIDNFIHKLYSGFKKGKSSNLNEKDTIDMEHIMSDYIRLLMNHIKGRESLDSFYYLCVVPREWDHDIREQLLRPIFTQAGLILQTDHNDRLLFLSDSESIFYAAQTKGIHSSRFGPGYFKTGNRHILCRIEPLENETKVSIKFDLIEAQPSLFCIPEKFLCPRILYSSACIMSEESIQCILSAFLEFKLFPDGIHQTNVIQTLTEYIYSSMKLRQNMLDNLDTLIAYLKKPWIIVEDKWMLNELQSNYLKSLSLYDICLEIGKMNLNVETKSYLFNTMRQYKPLFLYGYMPRRNSVSLWSRAVTEAVVHSLSFTSSNIAQTIRLENRPISILTGASSYLRDIMCNSDINSRPYVLSSKEQSSSSSIFSRKGADGIINIDISFSSTLISYSLVNEDSLIEMIPDNNYSISKKFLPPLKSFLKFSDVTTLMVDKKCITLIDNYLLIDNPNCLSIQEYYSQNIKNLLIQFEDILENIHSDNKTLVSTQQPRYIEAFMLMYFTYINELVVNGPLYQQQKAQKKKINIGFLLSVEMKLLECSIGTKDDLKKIVYKSGLVEMNDKHSKLRIVMQGERLWSAIQRQYKLRFPIKSCFVSAQLHENYVQLTLKQIVTDIGLEDAVQEAIILKDEIILIQNIYDSLCNNIWNNLTKSTSLIQMCKDHYGNDEYLFPRETVTQFTIHFREYISEKILKNNNDMQLDNKEKMQLGSTCNCVVSLSVRDIIDILFKPVLRDIASVVSTSLVNKEFFGLYNNIECAYIMMYFNENRQLQPILANLLGEEIVIFNETQNIDLYTLVIPELPNQHLQPTTIYQQSMYYRSFQFGDLQQTSSASYGFTVKLRKGGSYQDDVILYRERETRKFIDINDKLLILLKKGDIINNAGVNKVFYCTLSSDCIECDFVIIIYKLKGLESLESNGTIPVNRNDEWVDHIAVPYEEHNMEESLPLMISAENKGHSSSIEFSAKIVGQDKQPDWDDLCFFEVGESMVLERF